MVVLLMIPVLAAITEARQTRAVDAGTAGPVLLNVIDLACHLLERADALGRG